MCPAMGREGREILTPVLDLIMGLWQRADRDFKNKQSREAFRAICYAEILGENVNIPEPSANEPRDSVEWARYVASTDYKGIGKIIEGMLDRLVERRVDFMLNEVDS